jgi:anti-sigma regulatory factor (Ser/Thr protein kinase)
METNLLDNPVPGSLVHSSSRVRPQPREASSWRYAIEATAPSEARSNVTWFLERSRANTDDLKSATELIVSELVTNAYNAARSLTEPGVIELSLREFSDYLLVEVLDQSPELPDIREAQGDSESGRGLLLVIALSKEFGCFRYREKKVVYCILSLPSDAGK